MRSIKPISFRLIGIISGSNRGSWREFPIFLIGIIACIAASGCATAPAGSEAVLGATESIRVVEAGLDFRAVIDTGAHGTSIHALDLHVEDPAPRMEDNVGKVLSFRVVNEAGQARRVRAVIADLVPVRTSHGTEWRYVVPLRLRWGDVERRVRVNLRDRTPMSFKLLVGRDWIAGFLVDVERNPIE